MLVAGLMYISYDYFLKRDSQRTTKPFMAYAEVAADPFFFLEHAERRVFSIKKKAQEVQVQATAKTPAGAKRKTKKIEKEETEKKKKRPWQLYKERERSNC
ncbi:hypothetical protein BRADI_3g00184v3 [Brachypodium distachyon]|uniref:Uncharacterized protein n=1 Tax=Brachypodium distachyon TaxID=15368 RepID=A0A2K2CUE2_BRADI|nr:hypothetical protein BRADI_3g00184v3 [Brachypodium distachyon]